MLKCAISSFIYPRKVILPEALAEGNIIFRGQNQSISRFIFMGKAVNIGFCFYSLDQSESWKSRRHIITPNNAMCLALNDKDIINSVNIKPFIKCNISHVVNIECFDK